MRATIETTMTMMTMTMRVRRKVMMTIMLATMIRRWRTMRILARRLSGWYRWRPETKRQ